MSIPPKRLDKSEKSYRHVETWHKIHFNTAGRYGDIGQFEEKQIKFPCWCNDYMVLVPCRYGSQGENL